MLYWLMLLRNGMLLNLIWKAVQFFPYAAGVNSCKIPPSTSVFFLLALLFERRKLFLNELCFLFVEQCDQPKISVSV